MFHAVGYARAENDKDIKAAAPGPPLEQHRAEAPAFMGQQEDVSGFTGGINLLETYPGALKAAEKLAGWRRVTSDQQVGKWRVLISYLTDMREKSCKMRLK